MFDAFWIFWCSNTQIVFFFCFSLGSLVTRPICLSRKNLVLSLSPWLHLGFAICSTIWGVGVFLEKNSSRSRCFFLHSKKQWLRTEDAIKPCWDFFVRKVYIIDECMSFLLRNLNLAKSWKTCSTIQFTWMFLGKFWVYHYFETLRSHASISVSGDNLDDPFFYIWDSSQNPPKSGDVRLANLCF